MLFDNVLAVLLSHIQISFYIRAYNSNTCMYGDLEGSVFHIKTIKYLIPCGNNENDVVVVMDHGFTNK